jgi:hypothetical protein
MKYSGIRLYYTQATTNLASDSTAMPANTDWCNINLSSASTYRADIDIAADGTIASRKVEGGLENDKTYVFVMASIDKGGNVTSFSDPTPGNPWSLNTYGKHYATPGEVVGLLDGKKCFIATAAFGSEMAPQVEMLRKFRNLYLLKSEWGKSFVRFYYSVSPKLAEGISESPVLKLVVRTFLWPLVWFANLSINYGILLSLLLVSILSVALGFLIKKILVQVKQK